MTMNSNNAFESSASLGLSGLNVVIEDETDYVFVPGDFDDAIDEDDWDDDDDDDDWTNCDLSPSLSCATSVATIIEEMMMDIDGEENGRRTDNDNDAMETDEGNDSKTRRAVRKAFSYGNATTNSNTTNSMRMMMGSANHNHNPKNGRRLSNKKLRKKMKMLKKAAAARAAAEALAIANQKAMAFSFSDSGADDTAMEDVLVPAAGVGGESGHVSASARGSKSPKRKSHASNIQVACAQEALGLYREEIEAGRKAQRKMRAVSIDIQG